MAIIVSNTGNKTVPTIADRNALTSVFNGMQVTVVDAIADALVGIGSAAYQWSGALNKWVLMWKTSKDELIFANEAKVIVGGKVTANHHPQNGLVWSCGIRDSNGVLLDEIEPVVMLDVIDIESSGYDGHSLHYTYAYGNIEANPSPIYGGTF